MPRVAGFDGAKLQAIRESQDLSRLDVSRAIGTTEGAIYHYEMGYYSPSPARLRDLARFLGVRRSDLLDGDEAA